MREIDAGLLAYLDTVKSMANGRPSLTGLVRDKGALWTPARRPKGVRKMPNGGCFQHAFSLAHQNPDLIYVEGFADHIAPTLHAWCVTRAGVVVDPTWKDPTICAYYGIPFKFRWLLPKIIEQEYYGVLGTPLGVQALLDAPVDVYRESDIIPPSQRSA